ncbi:MAG: alpha-galactosidase, partial [Dysgonamonadaceae bacterium]|nr:alpha-galactosidase [Dysgonamonadaceae bacterium]
QIFQKDGKVAVTSKNPKTGETYLALFNLKDAENQDISVNFNELKLSGKHSVSDMWSKKSLGEFENEFSANLKPHSCILLKIR